MNYVILVNDDGSLYGSKKCRIMQREKLFNKLCILVPPHYNGYDMSQCTVTMRYILPISKVFKTETLVLSDERYEEYLKYTLPIDTNLTKECGDIRLNLTFIMLDVDDNGNVVQRVRKTDDYNLTITQIPDYDSVIPDEALAELDQRIIMQSAQIKSLKNIANILDANKVDNLVYNLEEDTLQLYAGDIGIGDKVSVKGMLEDGIPVVDFDSDSGSGSDSNNNNHENGCNCGCEDSVIEFGYSDVNIPEEPTEEDNVVEF